MCLKLNLKCNPTYVSSFGYPLYVPPRLRCWLSRFHMLFPYFGGLENPSKAAAQPQVVPIKSPTQKVALTTTRTTTSGAAGKSEGNDKSSTVAHPKGCCCFLAFSSAFFFLTPFRYPAPRFPPPPAIACTAKEIKNSKSQRRKQESKSSALALALFLALSVWRLGDQRNVSTNRSPIACLCARVSEQERSF